MSSSDLIFFLAILVGTLMISYWSAKRGTSTRQFYSASASLTGFQNGLAIAGDFMSAASFLGITGAIAMHGYDGFVYSIGFLVSYLLLFAIAEPIRHLGQFTLGDVIYARFPSNSMRLMTACTTIIVSVLYMVPQLVAAGLLMRLLLGINYAPAVVVTGILMVVYVIFGGMVSASWVQIIKTVLLLTATFLLVLIIFSRFHWHLVSLLASVVKESPLQSRFFLPGNLFHNPLQTLSINLSLVLGTAGLPHILIRFFTVRNAIEVRKTISTATWVIGLFYLMVLVLGMGVVAFVNPHQLAAVDPTGNLSALLLAKAVGGDFFMAFTSAVAFATILAVVTGLLLSATSAIAHDVYNHIFCHGTASEQNQLWIAKGAAFIVGVVAIALSLGMKHVNVAFPVSLTFVVAASTNLPLLLFTIYWRKFNPGGAVTGVLCGLISSLGLLLIDTHVIPVGSGWTAGFLSLNLQDPGVFTIPLGFIGAIVGTYIFRSQSSGNFAHILVKSHIGDFGDTGSR
jgi:cation/acetate symporter